MIDKKAAKREKTPLTKTIALVGNPNCGKTTLFNQLTGGHQKVGNWAGVTVDKKIGWYQHANQRIKVVDLPGIYALSVISSNTSLDELIACRYLSSQEADLVVNILDASNLRRNLYLTLQLLEMGLPCVIGINMMDVADKRKINIKLARLSQQLGCPVIPLVSHRNQGVSALKKAIANYQYHPSSKPAVPFSPMIEQAIEKLSSLMHTSSTTQSRWLATKLLERDSFASKLVGNRQIFGEAESFINVIETQAGEECDILIADARYQKIATIITDCVNSKNKVQRTATMYVDKIVMHRFLGIPIFLFIMYLLFQFSMNIGSLLQPLFDDGSTVIFVNGFDYLGHSFHFPPWLIAIFAHGVGTGINTVITFTPQIALLFLFLSFLEDSGYMARAAFVMDKLMQWVGLPGKSFIPLIIGFGCNVPAIMATRNLPNRRDRILTTMMSPFMSCGARLAIFVVFGMAFFPRHSGLMVFLLYLTGIGVAMLTGIILKKTLLKGEAAPFVMELPPYHLPHPRSIFMLTWQRTKGFLLRAGKIILPICVLVGSLNAIQPDGHVVPEGSKHSLLARVGQTVTPIFKPLGIEQTNWPATVGLITGTLAKEVVIGTLNTLYTQDQATSDNWRNFKFWDGLKAAVISTGEGFKGLFSGERLNPFTVNEADHTMTTSALGNMAAAFVTPWAAFAYLLFVLLYIPCVSTMGVIARELGKGWAYLSTLWSFSIAYTLAVMFYQVSQWTRQPLISSVWITGLIIFQLICFFILRRWGERRCSDSVAEVNYSE